MPRVCVHLSSDTFTFYTPLGTAADVPEKLLPNNVSSFAQNALTVSNVYPRNYTEEYLRAHIQQLAAFFSPDVFYRLDDLEIIENVLDYNKVDVETAGLSLTASCEESISRDLTELESVPAPPNYRINKNLDFTGGLMLVVNQSLATPFDVDISYKWLSLHGNQRFINLPGNGTPITPGTELHAGFIPNMLRVDEDAANLDRDQKRCRMSYEALEYFPVYHKQHCLMEIEMRRTIELCGCLKLGHLHVPGVPVCRARSLQCARLASVSFGKFNSNCPVTCDADAMDYFTTSSYDLNGNISPNDDFYADLDFTKVSILRIYVRHRHKVLLRKSYFTNFELFAQLGGLFSVFFGCSVLSIWELVMLLWRAASTKIASINRK
ncbi:hypothetical protein RR46_14550 [Papilio xuthus]|uniref:Sodium channel protein Nach n=1 Tax=Papilio xuthus TaxID=66420 RepID=A0A194PCM7_PAPXU|nr:hypothetical protein RR46_14550 [Papilio xuthus]